MVFHALQPKPADGRPRGYWNCVLRSKVKIRVYFDDPTIIEVHHGSGNGRIVVKFRNPDFALGSLRKYFRSAEELDSAREHLVRLISGAEDSDPDVVRPLEVTVPHHGARHFRTPHKA